MLRRDRKPHFPFRQALDTFYSRLSLRVLLIAMVSLHAAAIIAACHYIFFRREAVTAASFSSADMRKLTAYIYFLHFHLLPLMLLRGCLPSEASMPFSFLTAMPLPPVSGVITSGEATPA